MTSDSLFTIKPAVEFVNVKEQYSFDDDLECVYKYHNYKPQEGDRVAIYKVCWSYVKDYIVFEWAPTHIKQDINSVIFSRHVLPKNTSDLYQICYISGENEVQSATSTFQFVAGSRSKSSTTNFMVNSYKLEKTEASSSEKELREEVKLLRESLKAVVYKDKVESNISELWFVIDNLKSTVVNMQSQIQTLNEKINKIDATKSIVQDKEDNLPLPNNDSHVINNDTSLDNTTIKPLPDFPFLKLNSNLQ